MTEDGAEEIRIWVRGVLDQTGLTPTELARKAGLAHSTLTRFLAGEGKNILSSRTIAKIAQVARITPRLPSFQTTATGPRIEAMRFEGSVRENFPETLGAAVSTVLKGRPHAQAWVLSTYLLEDAGILPGDILIVDTQEFPGPAGAKRIACVENHRTEPPQTIFRIYDTPFLLTATSPRFASRPLLHDRDTVIIKGVVTEILRSLELDPH